MLDINKASTEALLAAIRQDKDAVFTQLVKQLHTRMFSLARSLLSKHEAEDAVQDAWISAYRGIDNFEGRSSLHTWLSRIVINEARMRLRKSGREINLDVVNSEPDALAARFRKDGHWSEPPLKWEAGTPEELLQEQTRRRYWSCATSTGWNWRIYVTCSIFLHLMSVYYCIAPGRKCLTWWIIIRGPGNVKL